MEEIGPEPDNCQDGPTWCPEASASLQQVVHGPKRQNQRPVQRECTDILEGGLFGPKLGPHDSSTTPTK